MARNKSRSNTFSLPKLTPPRLGKIYHRERLFTLLDGARKDHSVIWIGAPAGSGKTTLAASYLQQRQLNTLWYQVDAGDQDLAAFFYYLGKAAKRSGVRKALPLFTPEYQLGLPVFTRNFFRELFAGLRTPAVIVLDNLQEAGADTPLHTVLQQAAEEIPHGVQLIVTSRAQPPPALARLQANDVLYEVNAEQMLFNEAEHTALVQLLGGELLSQDQLRQIYRRTRGWATGAILYLRQYALAGNDARYSADVPESLAEQAHIFDYFAVEILASTDAATREFLYAVAELPVMTISLCEALTGASNAKAILNQLEKNNFFTTRRGLLNPSYDFHPLFRDYLLAQAAAHFDAPRLHALQCRAGLLLAAAGDIENAVPLLEKTQSWPGFTALIKQHAETMEKQGRHQTLLDWLNALPRNVVAHDPTLLYWLGMAHLPKDPSGAYCDFEQAYGLFREHDDAKGVYLSWIGAVTALTFRHDDMTPVVYWMRELEDLRVRYPRWPNLEIRIRMPITVLGIAIHTPITISLSQWIARVERLYRFVPIDTVRCVAGAHLGLYYAFFGDMGKLRALSRHLETLLESTAIPPVVRLFAAIVPIFDGWQSGDDARARHAIDVGMKLIDASGVYVTTNWLLAIACLVHLTHGREQEAAALLARFRENLDVRHRSEAAYLDLSEGWRELLLGRPDAAKTYFAAVLEVTETMNHYFLNSQARGGLIQACIALRDFAAARSQLAILRQQSREAGNTQFGEFYCNYLDAWLHDNQGDPIGAVAALRVSFGAAVRNHWVVMSCWEPVMVTRLCVLALQHGIEPEYVKNLIRIYKLTPARATEPIEQWPYPVKLYTLGRFSLVRDGVPLSSGGKAQKKPLELLKTLLALGGREVNAAQLMEALWPQSDGDAASQAYHVTLKRLRDLIGDTALIQEGGHLTLNPDVCWVDVWVFERALGQAGDDLDKISNALIRYRGHFFTGEDAPHLLSARERLKALYLKTVTTLGEKLEHSARHHDAQTLYETALKIDDLNESFYQGLMRTHAALNQPEQVRTTYERLRKLLKARLDLTPSAGTEQLKQALLSI